MSAHRQGVRIFGVPLDQTSQMGQSGINEPSDPLDLSLGPQRFPPRVPVNIEAGSSRRAQGAQLIDSVSASRPNNLRGEIDRSQGPADVVDLVSEDEDDEDDDGDDLATSSRKRPLMMRAINDPGLVAENAARNRRLRINNDPLPSNSNLEVAAAAAAPLPPPPPPRRPPTFNCQICLESYFEGMTTKCGHIFCSSCITTAVSAQRRCPSCRAMINPWELIRISVPNPL